MAVLVSSIPCKQLSSRQQLSALGKSYISSSRILVILYWWWRLGMYTEMITFNLAGMASSVASLVEGKMENQSLSDWYCFQMNV